MNSIEISAFARACARALVFLLGRRGSCAWLSCANGCACTHACTAPHTYQRDKPLRRFLIEVVCEGAKVGLVLGALLLYVRDRIILVKKVNRE